MKRTLCLAASISLSASMAFAGQVTFTGVGRVASAPDYVELSLTINSECYRTPSTARAETDRRVAKIVEFLKTKIDQSEGSKDVVLASGGYSAPFSRSYYTVDGARHTACEGTFQKNTVVTLKKSIRHVANSAVSDFARDFDEIQEKVLAEFKSEPTGDNHDLPVTFVSIGSPQPQLFHETAAAAQKAALALAMEDAISKLESTFGSCPISSYHIANYSDQTEAPREMSYMRESAVASSSDAGSVAPVVFDDLWTKQSLKVQFNFEGGYCTKRSKN